METMAEARVQPRHSRRWVRVAAWVVGGIVVLNVAPLALGSWPAGPRRDICEGRAEHRFGKVEALTIQLDIPVAHWRPVPPGWACDFKRRP
jgi:hypothetical protein